MVMVIVIVNIIVIVIIIVIRETLMGFHVLLQNILDIQNIMNFIIYEIINDYNLSISRFRNIND